MYVEVGSLGKRWMWNLGWRKWCEGIDNALEEKKFKKRKQKREGGGNEFKNPKLNSVQPNQHQNNPLKKPHLIYLSLQPWKKKAQTLSYLSYSLLHNPVRELKSIIIHDVPPPCQTAAKHPRSPHRRHRRSTTPCSPSPALPPLGALAQ